MAIIKMGAQDDASEIKFNNSTSRFNGMNVQEVLEEISDGNIILPTGWKSNGVLIEHANTNATNTSPGFYEIEPAGFFFCYHFADNKNQNLQMMFHIDHDILPNSLIYPNIHWEPDSTDTGVVRWVLKWTAVKGHSQNSIVAAPANSGEIIIEAVGSGNVNEHITSTTTQSLPYLEPDTVLLINLEREGQHQNDTFIGTVGGLMLSLHYQSNGESTPSRVPPFHTH